MTDISTALPSDTSPSESKLRVLFVDDEQNVLQGLRRMLREKRGEWDMHFAVGGNQAVEMLEKEPFDVVVSDMRMPDLDGASVLRKALELRPEATRIVLSGFADQEAVLRTVGPAHQYLSKPCDAATIIETIGRTIGLRRRLPSQELRKLMAGIEVLPTLDGAFQLVIGELTEPNASAASVERIISKDVGLSANLLKITNSAFYGLSQKVSSVRSAIQLLGFDTLLAIVTNYTFSHDSPVSSGVLAEVERLSMRSVQIGLLAKEIARAIGLNEKSQEHASCAGVLSHTGSLVFMTHWAEKFTEAKRMADERQGDIISAERDVLGAAHPEFGAYLLGLWGFCDPVIEAIAFHHEPVLSMDTSPSVLTALHLAQHHARREGQEEGVENHIQLDAAYLERLGIADKIERWLAAVPKLESEAVA